VSQDLSRPTRTKGCVPTSAPGSCWLNAILEARSDDMGGSFRLGGTVAAPAAEYPSTASGRVGVFTTSNIAAKGDGFYMLAWAEGGAGQQRGNCLFRSPDPLLPGSWRAWDGTDFSVDMRDAARSSPCRPVSPSVLTNEVRSITWSSHHERWIAVLASRRKLAGDAAPIPGFYQSVSADLIHWSELTRIMAAPTRAREEQMDTVASYPSLIDPDSRSRNFDTLEGEAPLLLFTVHHLRNGKGTLNRDLMAVPLKLSVGG
jgi:hypothetical protein